MREYMDIGETMTEVLRWILKTVIAISEGVGPNSRSLDDGGNSVYVANRISWTPSTIITGGSLFTEWSIYRFYYDSDEGALKAVLDNGSGFVSVISYFFPTLKLEALASLPWWSQPLSQRSRPVMTTHTIQGRGFLSIQFQKVFI